MYGTIVGTQSDIRDQLYRTEPDIGASVIGLKRSESDNMSDIEINFVRYTVSDISFIADNYYSLRGKVHAVK
jgi:hypothetical protein